ncbi:MAG: serine hydrolase [Nitrospiraceae bacterium]|nr:serine hydrolase [Nitrospiraceae bacterium]
MPTSKIAGIFCICCLWLAALGCGDGDSAGSPQAYGNAVATARSGIWKAINTGKCGSATAAVMVDGQIVYAEGFGMANREQGIPVDTATRFNIASVSKMFVTTSIMMLVDEGSISLDKPVTAYLPEFRMADERYKNITVRMLLNHSSGMPGGELANTSGYRLNNNAKQETMDTLARAHLKHDPGAKAEYCNDGFTLAEMIVERLSKGPYLDFLRERIIKPLGLESTALSLGTLQGKPVALYYDPKTGKLHPPETISVFGTGGLSSTAVDLCRFAEVFSPDSQLLKKDSLAEMSKAQPSAFQGKLRHLSDTYGLGWDLAGLPRYEAAGIRILAKSGNSGNYSSYLLTVPDKRISVAVIASGPDSDPMSTAFDILDAVLVEKKLMPKEEKPVFIPPAAQKWPQEDASYGGYYANGNGLSQVVFDAENNRVALYIFTGREKTPIASLIYNGGYYYDAEGQRYYFTGATGESYLVNWAANTGLDAIKMQKIRPMENPQSLRIDMDGKTWLRRNVAPYETASVVSSHLSKSLLYGDLPGYVFFYGMKRVISPEFAGMPVDAIANLTELTLFDNKGAAWAWVSDLLVSPSEAAVALKAGENSVTIGADGYNEWLLANADTVLSFTKPQQGRIIIFSPDGSALYDSVLDSGDTYIARGSYIEVAGSPGDIFTVKAAPVAADAKKK